MFETYFTLQNYLVNKHVFVIYIKYNLDWL